MCNLFCGMSANQIRQGDGDSEIALVVEDQDEVESRMNGQPVRLQSSDWTKPLMTLNSQYMATRFAASLRRKLFRGLSSMKRHRPS